MITISGTPWEKHDGIWVKREDLCSPYPGPSFSKIRGVEQHIIKLMNSSFPPTSIGVVDSRHSKAGWGVSYICQLMKIPVTVFYPILKGETELRPFQKMCDKLDAGLVGLPATKSAVLFYQARKLFQNWDSYGYLMPNGLKLRESVLSTEKELLNYTPENLLRGTWIISISSGTIAAGVLSGLTKFKFKGKIYLHMGYSRSKKAVKNYLNSIGHNLQCEDLDLELIDEGYNYKDRVDNKCPFACNPYYDLKAWKWVTKYRNKFESPIVFWNIGS